MKETIAEKKEWRIFLKVLKNEKWVSLSRADLQKRWKEEFGDKRLTSPQLRQVEKDLGF